MSNLPPEAEAVLALLADLERFGIPVAPSERLTEAGAQSDEDWGRLIADLVQRGLVASRPRGVVLTENGREAVRLLCVLPAEGAIQEFAAGLAPIHCAILDAVVEWELRNGGTATSRSHARTSARNAVTPRPEIEAASNAIDFLVGSRLSLVGGGPEPSYQVTLSGLLASRWGMNALTIIDKTRDYLHEVKNKTPSLSRYSWGQLRAAVGMPAQGLNLAHLSITHARLGKGLFLGEGDYWWTTPPDLDVLLERTTTLDYLRDLVHAESRTIAWTELAPHKPLREGDPLYAKRPEGGGTELSEAVRAGWRRIAIVGPMGVGKSTELAAAQQALHSDRFAFRIGMNLSFDMRRVRVGEVFKHVLEGFLSAKPNPTVETTIRMADELVEGDRRDFRRDLARKALRSAGRATLLIDGLEKADEQTARAVAEEFFGLGDDAEVVLVVPASLAYGPGAGVLGDDVRLFPIRPVLTWGEPADAVVSGRLFLREVALRHLRRPTVRPDEEKLLQLVEAASVWSGGVPRTLLQLLRDAHRQAVVARRAMPSLDDLERAIEEHGEYLRRSLVAGDVEVLAKAEGQDGSEVPLERKLRLLLQGLLLEYRRGDRTAMHMAPTLARALRIPQALS